MIILLKFLLSGQTLLKAVTLSFLLSYACDPAMHVDGDVLWHGGMPWEVTCCGVKGVTRVCTESVSLVLHVVKACRPVFP